MSNCQLLKFTSQQNRQQIINSALNSSKSKAFWTFSKQTRFQQPNSISQRINFYNITSQEPLRLRNHSYGFGKSQRKLFTQISQAPLPGQYNPEKQLKIKKNGITFGESRQNCKARSYINNQKIKNPGPNQYRLKSLQKSIKFTMRPKTGHSKTYFVQNKQAMNIPGPGTYNEESSKLLCSTMTSKYRQNSLGSCSGMSKTKRFKTESDKKLPFSTNLYDNLNAPWAKGCPIGSQKRKSFIETILKQKQIPGPGNYQLPSQFGHYKKIKSIIH